MQSIRSESLRNSRSSGHRRARSSKAGFSLLEVLAALLVTMLLVLAFSPYVSQMLATWSRGAEVANLVELKTRGLGRMREDLRHAVVWTGYGEIQDLAAFEGDETSMSFPVVAGLGSAGTGIEYLSFAVGSGIDGRALIRRRAPVIGSTYGAFVDPVVLFSGPYRYVFRYYGREGNAQPTWAKGRGELPARIELDIVDRGGRLLLHMPIVLTTFASMSAGCIAARGMAGCPVTQESVDDALKMFMAPGEGKS
jgi:general secretion pathway protein J